MQWADRHRGHLGNRIIIVINIAGTKRKGQGAWQKKQRALWYLQMTKKDTHNVAPTSKRKAPGERLPEMQKLVLDR
jgi:hypothetical protein